MAEAIINNSQYIFNYTVILNVLNFIIMLTYFLSTLAIILNIFVIYMLLKLRLVTNALNLLLMNLSLSDLLKSFSLIISSSLAVAGARNTYMLKPTLAFWTTICKLNYFIMLSTSFSASFSLTALAIERFRAIYFPLEIRSDYRQYLIVVAFIWILSLGASAYTLVSYHIIPIYPYFCLLNGEYFLGNNVWLIITGLMCSIIPVIITIICYIMIAVKLCGRNLMIDSSMIHSEFLRKRRREIISIVSLLIMTIMSTFSNCNYYLYLIIALAYHSNHSFQSIKYYTDSTLHNVNILQVSILLTVAQTSIDPILYNFVSSNFRKSIKECTGISLCVRY